MIDRYLKMRDAPCHFVEGGKHGDRILDLVGARIRRAERRHGGDEAKQESEANAG
jgi:hypothetical protein